MPVKISLLHATYHREAGPLELKECWLERADRADLVEYILAMDADDEATVKETEGHLRVVGPTGHGRVTSVRNWNAAAAVATGELLMVIADDLFPPQGWDTALVEMIEPLNPARTPFAMKVTDSRQEGALLLRHPVISKAFYARHGLFSDLYDGVYCDYDITMRGFWRSVILDGRSLTFEHRHPPLNALVSESHRRVNIPQEYEHGKAVYIASWSRRQRSARLRFVPVVPKRRLRPSVLRFIQCENCARETAAYLLRPKAFIKLILRPRELLKRLSGS